MAVIDQQEVVPVSRTVEVTSPMTILDRAITQGAPIDVVERISALVKDWEDRAAKKEFAQAMARAQQHMPTVFKDATNPEKKSKYASLENVQEIIHPIYTAEGLSLTWTSGESPRPGILRIFCDVMHIGGHERRYQGDYAIDGTGPKGGQFMNAVQGVVSTNTYAQRDMLRLIFNLTISGQDKDGERDTGPISEQQIDELQMLIDEFDAAGGWAPGNWERFTVWACYGSKEKAEGRTGSVAEIPAFRFTDVKKWLVNKIAEKAKE